VALLHDAADHARRLRGLQKEMTLGTIAAVLTVIGYSINDNRSWSTTVFSRTCSACARANLAHLINVSTSETSP